MSKLTLITGAAGGLGRALTERLHGQAWPLALVSREAVRLRDAPADALTIAADCTTAECAARVMALCVEHFGRAPDALAHCAGTVLLAPLHRTSPVQYREVVRANLDSALFHARCIRDQQAVIESPPARNFGASAAVYFSLSP